MSRFIPEEKLYAVRKRIEEGLIISEQLLGSRFLNDNRTGIYKK